MNSLSQSLIRLIREKPIEQHDLEQAALLVLDASANFVAGATSEPGRRLYAWAREARITDGDRLGRDSGRSAFLLGALTHTLEVDDLHRQSVTHPGCAVVPVLWALAASSNRSIPGRQALEAVLHGYEAIARVGASAGTAHYKIWHNTGTCGPFGSAMTAAHILRLNAQGCVDALGNAGTQSAGLWEFLETGAMTKHLHAGRAAEAGLVAATLAHHGLSGAPAIFEGARGFFAAMCPDAKPDRLLAEPDQPWQVHVTSLKPWPSCRHTHPAIDAALSLRQQIPDLAENIDALKEIQVGTYDAAIALCDQPHPGSAYAAKFSLQHCVAAALAHGDIWFESFEEASRSSLRDLRSRVRLTHNPAFEAHYPKHWGCALELEKPNGERIAAERLNAKGDPEAPLSRDETLAKADRLMRMAGLTDPQTLIDGICAMATNSHLPALPDLFGGGKDAPAKAAG